MNKQGYALERRWVGRQLDKEELWLGSRVKIVVVVVVTVVVVVVVVVASQRRTAMRRS